MLVTSEAVVLRSRKQGETSKIVTLYTKEFGKVNVIAKGAREMKSKFGGALEMFALTSVVFYKKESDEPGLYLLSKAETVARNTGISESLERMGSAMAIIELLLRALHDEETNVELFSLLRETLTTLARIPEPLAPTVEFRFYLEFARMMGFEIEMESVAEHVSPELTATLFAIRDGAPGQPDDHIEAPLDEKAVRMARSFFGGYFTEHVPGLTARSLKSGRIFGQL